MDEDLGNRGLAAALNLPVFQQRVDIDGAVQDGLGGHAALVDEGDAEVGIVKLIIHQLDEILDGTAGSVAEVVEGGFKALDGTFTAVGVPGVGAGRPIKLTGFALPGSGGLLGERGLTTVGGPALGDKLVIALTDAAGGAQAAIVAEAVVPAVGFAGELIIRFWGAIGGDTILILDFHFFLSFG